MKIKIRPSRSTQYGDFIIELRVTKADMEGQIVKNFRKALKVLEER